MEEKKHRIVFAFYSEKWVYKKDNSKLLEEYSIEVVPEEFTKEMKKKIFCPLCATPLSRSPSITSVSKNNITAHFRHGDKAKYVESKGCSWRAPSVQGFKYESEEEAKQAVENEDLTIVREWMDSPPSSDKDTDETEEFNQTAIEDEEGPETEMSIGRHKGEIYKLPSKISTVMALCKEFPKNLRRGFYFPNSQFPMMLSDQLHSVERIKNSLPSNETLFFGKIKNYDRLDYRNMIFLQVKSLHKFKIYTDPLFDIRKRISEKSIGRYIIFSAKIYWENENSIVACKVLKWGAYSLLPSKYDKYMLGM